MGFAPANLNKLSKDISHKNPLNTSNNPNNSQNYRGIAGVLPFFEDFSTSQTFPDTAFWTNSGTIINNTRADNAPSLGVATLDAFNINGTPYNIASPLSQGYSDTLTAKIIDLSSILPTATDVFFSFWWQAGGKVEAPDASDFLLLQGKDNANNWVEIWRKYGDGTFTTFKQENIQLINNFFHSGFQFRFLRFGRVSGDFDAWHLDYIYLDKNRTLADTTRQDVAFSRQPKSYLKNYTAMPVKQYFVNQVAEINTEIITNINNLDSVPRINADYDCELKNTRSNVVLATLPITTSAPIIQVNDPNFLVTATPQLLPIPTNTSLPILLEYSFRFTSTDASVPVDFKVNDTIKGRTELDNYFAYDDGTAEYVAGIAQTQGKIAVQYKLNQPAVITDIDICFVPFKQNLSQETFILSIWKKVNGRTDEILFQKSLQVKYPTSTNGFVRFAVDSTKIVNIVDTFYVGIQQTSNDLLAIGFDKDNNAQTKTFFNIQGNWEQDPLIKGALMIRPVFDNDVFAPSSVTALDNQNDSKSISLFPNPSKVGENNIIKIKSLTPITSLHLYNAQGQIQEVIFDKENQNITTKNLSKGLYVALLKDIQGKVFSKKIVLE